MDTAFRHKLQAAVALSLPYEDRTVLAGGRAASVLFLFGSSASGLSMLITRRTDSVGSHKGQMAFPGGVSEPEELRDGDGVIRTALRETQEEVGIAPDALEVVGTLPPLTTVTGYEVTPVVGMLREPIEKLELVLNAHEIAEALWVPLSTLLESGTYRREFIRVGEGNYPIHVYQVREHRIWGATGSMIKNLLDRLHALG